MLESACEACLAFELADRGLRIERQKVLPLMYRGLQNRTLKRHVGLLINFNVQWLVRDGLHRIVNNFPE